jgi:hypothetical protein
MMATALIGSSGFVGGSLLAQTTFDDLYRSTNIEEIAGRKYELLVCAGAPAAKWKANQAPSEDLANLRRLMAALETVQVETAILISSVDVYHRPLQVDETTVVDPEKADAYGKHRFYLEEYFERHFARCFRVRLPGLFGRGLRKNFLFDLLRNPQALPLTHAASRFQFYDMSCLWADLSRVTAAGLPLVNFATEPVMAGEVARRCFGVEFDNVTRQPPVAYDMRTVHAGLWNSAGDYIMPSEDVFTRISDFVRSEGGSG